MEERRRYKRIPIKLQLEIDGLFKQNNEMLQEINAEIEVLNISKTGLAFIAQQELPLDYYFHAKIELNEKDFVYAVIKIIRNERIEEGYLFGCEFVGLAEFLAKKIERMEENSEEWEYR